MHPPSTLLTIGHGTADQQHLAALLEAAAVRAVVDVRRFPGSRRHPHVATVELERWLPNAGIKCRWEARLGGRRRVPPTEAGARAQTRHSHAGDHLALGDDHRQRRTMRVVAMQKSISVVRVRLVPLE